MSTSLLIERLVPLVPALGILTCGYMMYALPADTWIRLIVWMGLGLVIYFTYGRSHSVLARTGHSSHGAVRTPEAPSYTDSRDEHDRR